MKLGRVNLDLGNQAEADQCCSARPAIYERSGGDPAELAMALEDYAVVLRKAGRGAEADKVEARARSLRIGHPHQGAETLKHVSDH